MKNPQLPKILMSNWFRKSDPRKILNYHPKSLRVMWGLKSLTLSKNSLAIKSVSWAIPGSGSSQNCWRGKSATYEISLVRYIAQWATLTMDLNKNYGPTAMTPLPHPKVRFSAVCDIGRFRQLFVAFLDNMNFIKTSMKQQWRSTNSRKC